MTPTSPIDRVHVECLDMRRVVRERIAAARAEVAEWNLTPCPPHIVTLPPERAPRPALTRKPAPHVVGEPLIGRTR